MLPNYEAIQTPLIFNLLSHLSQCMLDTSLSPAKASSQSFSTEISSSTSLVFVYDIFFSAFRSFLRRATSSFRLANFFVWTLARMLILSLFSCLCLYISIFNPATSFSNLINNCLLILAMTTS